MQLIDLQAQYEYLKKDIDEGIQKVLNRAAFIMGEEVAELENELAAYLGVKHCVSCANGTDALQFIYMAYGIGHGDAVFCPDLTFIASVEPACMLGATPVFCDIDSKTYNISVESLERQINNVIKAGVHTPRAVVAVDFLGNPSDYDSLKTICNKYNLLLIEDGAQSFGAEYKGKKCCSIGDISTTSFFPAKPLGCYGDGGAIFTNNDEFADVFRSIRVHGKGSSKYDNIRIGVNSRLDTIQAAVLKVKFNALKTYEIQNRQKIANKYNQAFKNVFVTPFVQENCISNYAQYALLAKNNDERNRIIEHLNNNNIPNMIYYPTPQHLLKVYAGNPYITEDFSVTENYCKTTFSIPMHPYLTGDEQDLIIKTVLEAV